MELNQAAVVYAKNVGPNQQIKPNEEVPSPRKPASTINDTDQPIGNVTISQEALRLSQSQQGPNPIEPPLLSNEASTVQQEQESSSGLPEKRDPPPEQSRINLIV